MLHLAARFLLELVGVAAAACAGWAIAAGSTFQPVVAIGAALILVTAWALVAAPKAHNPLAPRTRELIGTGFLLLVAGALAWAGQPGVAAAFAAAVVLNQVLLVAFEADAGAIAAHYAAGR